MNKPVFLNKENFITFIKEKYNDNEMLSYVNNINEYIDNYKLSCVEIFFY